MASKPRWRPDLALVGTCTSSPSQERKQKVNSNAPAAWSPGPRKLRSPEIRTKPQAGNWEMAYLLLLAASLQSPHCSRRPSINTWFWTESSGVQKVLAMTLIRKDGRRDRNTRKSKKQVKQRESLPQNRPQTTHVTACENMSLKRSLTHDRQVLCAPNPLFTIYFETRSM